MIRLTQVIVVRRQIRNGRDHHACVVEQNVELLLLLEELLGGGLHAGQAAEVKLEEDELAIESLARLLLQLLDGRRGFPLATSAEVDSVGVVEEELLDGLVADAGVSPRDEENLLVVRELVVISRRCGGERTLPARSGTSLSGEKLLLGGKRVVERSPSGVRRSNIQESMFGVGVMWRRRSEEEVLGQEGSACSGEGRCASSVWKKESETTFCAGVVRRSSGGKWRREGLSKIKSSTAEERRNGA